MDGRLSLRRRPERAGYRDRKRRASEGHQAPSDHHSARQPLGYGGLARDQDPARLGARHRGPDRAGLSRDLRLQRRGREGDRAAQDALLERGKVMSERLTPAEYEVVGIRAKLKLSMSVRSYRIF